MPSTLVRLGSFSLNALEEGFAMDAESRSSLLRQAVHYYMNDRGEGRAGWAYPRFRLEGGDASELSDIRLEIDASTWEAFTEEAARQSVSPDRLLEHAVLYFVADRESGRLAQRVVDDLGETEPGDLDSG